MNGASSFIASFVIESSSCCVVTYRECAYFTLFFILGGDRGGFRGGFGDRGRGGRGRGRGRGRGKEDKEWIPVTKLGRLVKDGLEEIYLYSLPIKDHKIIDMFIGPALKDEVLKIMPVQKQTRAGQRTRFKAFVGKLYAYFV